MHDKPLLLIIAGPTAVGKTKNSLDMALELNGEIISADSMQIYKYMNIGTAKPSPKEMKNTPHHLIDMIEPDETFTVVDFKREAEDIMQNILKREKIPILVGGTGLYIKSIIDNYYFSPGEIDIEFREKMKKIAGEKGNKHLYKLLTENDNLTAGRLHENDIKRIIRALEVKHLTGKPISYYEEINNNIIPPYNLLYFGLTMDRNNLYRNIEIRVDQMIERGLIDEVKNLLNMGFEKKLNSMKGLGYKQIIEYLDGKYSLDEAIYNLKRDTKRYAKRQFTWFNRDKRIIWIDIEKTSVLEHFIDNYKFMQEKYWFPRSIKLNKSRGTRE